MIKKRVKKLKKVKDLVPSDIAEKASNLNPLTPARPEDAMKLEDVPQITNETIAVHREEVLKGARKYIYPLQHSKHRILVVTGGLLAVAIAGFLIYCGAALYRYYQYNTFLYRVTQVVPFPIAHTGGTYIAYENYLFELRHYVHYYENQLSRNFSSPDDQQQLVNYRKQALQDVVNQAYIKILAKQNHVSVSDKEVNDRINLVREQNRLGSNNKVFSDVLRDYWGWSISDFKRSLKEQILAEKVVAKLDTDANTKVNSVLAQAKSGTDFAELAKLYSEDPNGKANSGDFGFAITKSNPNVPPQIIDTVFKLKPGQVSGVVNTGKTLEIVKVEQVSGDSVTARHIVFNLKDINTYTKPVQQQHPVNYYVKF
jgi:hypothetical protein